MVSVLETGHTRYCIISGSDPLRQWERTKSPSPRPSWLVFNDSTRNKDDTTVGVGHSRRYCNTGYDQSQGRRTSTRKCIGSISKGDMVLSRSLYRIPLRRFPLRRIPLSRFPLRRFQLRRFSFRRIPLCRFPFCRMPLCRFPFRRIPLCRFPFRRIPLCRF